MITITINLRKLLRIAATILVAAASLGTAGYNGLILVRMRHWWSVIGLAVTKTTAASLAPILAIWGVVLGLVGLWRRNPAVVALSAVSTTVPAVYTALVTRQHDAFERAFGADWETQIPPTIAPHMLQTRLHLIPPRARTGAFHRNVVVGTQLATQEPLLADIWEPPNDIPRSGLLFLYLHGGAWHYGQKDLGTRYFFRHLTNQGHVILDLAYTMAHQAHLPDMIGDVREAIAWSKRNAARYGVNPERIVVSGGSAGGHLALMTAYTSHEVLAVDDSAESHHDLSVRGVVALYPPVDLRAIQLRSETRYGRIFQPDSLLSRVLKRAGAYPLGLIPKLVGGPLTDVPDQYTWGSPVNHVSAECPPTLVIQGTHDVFDWLNDTRFFVQKLRAARVPVVYVELPLTDHAFDLALPRISPAAQSAFYDIDRFLALMV